MNLISLKYISLKSGDWSDFIDVPNVYVLAQFQNHQPLLLRVRQTATAFKMFPMTSLKISCLSLLLSRVEQTLFVLTLVETTRCTRLDRISALFIQVWIWQANFLTLNSVLITILKQMQQISMVSLPGKYMGLLQAFFFNNIVKTQDRKNSR